MSIWVCSNWCPSSHWCPPSILSSVVPFSSCPQSFPASGSFQWVSSSHHIAKILSFSFSVSSSNEYSRLISFRIDWFDLISLLPKGLSRVFSSTTIGWKASILQHSVCFMVQLSYPYMTVGKTITLTVCTFVSKVMFLLLNTLFRFVITFLPRSKHLLISWLQSPSAVILEAKKIKSVTVSTFSPSICHEMMGPDIMILVFWMLSLKPAFSLFSFTLIKRLFSSSSLSAFRVVSSDDTTLSY